MWAALSMPVTCKPSAMVTTEKPTTPQNSHLNSARSKCVRSRQRPALRLDCGTGDFLLEQNRAFTAFLKSIRYTHDYAEFPGAHEWSYWDTQVQEALAFHRKYLEIAVYQ